MKAILALVAAVGLMIAVPSETKGQTVTYYYPSTVQSYYSPYSTGTIAYYNNPGYTYGNYYSGGYYAPRYYTVSPYYNQPYYSGYGAYRPYYSGYQSYQPYYNGYSYYRPGRWR